MTQTDRPENIATSSPPIPGVDCPSCGNGRFCGPSDCFVCQGAGRIIPIVCSECGAITSKVADNTNWSTVLDVGTKWGTPTFIYTCPDCQPTRVRCIHEAHGFCEPCRLEILARCF